MSTVYLVTGANRGIGRGFAEAILSRPHTIIVAAVRDPLKKSSQSLLHLDHGASSKLILVKIDSKSETDPADAVRFLQDQGIAHLDVVISNAGISTASSFSTVASVPLATVKEHVEVNCYGPLVLFQAVVPLLQKSKKPVFITIGSRVGSIACMEQMPFPIAAYAPSKAMLHWITRKIHFENEHLISFVISPGYVQTDMGNEGPRQIGVGKSSLTVKESVAGMVKLIEDATRQKNGGRFYSWDGSECPW